MDDRFRFRVWDKEVGSFILKKNEFAIDASGTGYIIECGLSDSYAFYLDADEESCYIVQQCTGLKDKNGVLIYEGDIVKRTGCGYAIGEIMWRNDKHAWRFRYKDSDEKLQTCGLGYGRRSLLTTEIIGNIFENPELLEK